MIENVCEQEHGKKQQQSKSETSQQIRKNIINIYIIYKLLKPFVLPPGYIIKEILWNL